jgi:hypothetical protein
LRLGVSNAGQPHEILLQPLLEADSIVHAASVDALQDGGDQHHVVHQVLSQQQRSSQKGCHHKDVARVAVSAD